MDTRPGQKVGRLVLTRRAGEAIHIGEDITVHVMEVVGKTVRLCVVAPKAVTVLRDDAINTTPRTGGAA